MDLIIVESPTKAKTLARFLGDGYEIEASMGHIRDLPEKKIGIDPDHDFAIDYVVSEKKREKVADLKKKSRKATKTILATDPDREGEAIAYHLQEVLTEDAKSAEVRSPKFERVAFHEITENAVKNALNKPGAVNMQLVDAQQARRVLDRLVGYKLSPLLWRKIRRGLSAGRVQSVAVRLIVEREREIAAFVPMEYWDVIASFKSPGEKEGREFKAKLTKIDGKTAELKSGEESEKIVEELKPLRFMVGDIQTKEVKRSPYSPFTTSTLQQAASNLFGWTAKKTMQIAQGLYEEGQITYHRTDSTNLAIEAVSAARDFIKREWGEKYLPEGARLYKTKSKVAQEAHEAIRPTQIGQLTNTKGSFSGRDAERLYELIWRRFISCQMKDCITEQTGVDIVAGRFVLRSNGSRKIFDGWTKATIKDGAVLEEENELPVLQISQMLNLIEVFPGQHFTEPPPRYTEASLIKALEEFGIGRPSTYAPIISTILERQYVEKIDKRLGSTSLGNAVTDFLAENFSSVMDYQFTAHMEGNLDAIANGEKDWIPVVREFYTPFFAKLEEVQKNAKRVKVAVEETDEICPECQSPLVIRIGKFGKFIACSKFPDCKFTKTYSQKVDIKCPKCGGEVVLKKTKSRKNFYGCANYPNCDFASWTKPKVPESRI